MSQCLYRTTYQGAPVEIMAGWDHMTGEIFLNVGYLDEEHDDFRDDLPLILETWKRLEERPTDVEEALELVERIKHKVSTLGLKVPDAMLREVALHIANDTGNLIVRFDEHGSRTEQE